MVVCPDEWDWAGFAHLLSRHRGAAVAIDCYADIYRQSPDQDPAEAMRAFLHRLRRLFARYDANGIVVDHAKRGSAGSKTPEFYGSAQKKGAIRQMWTTQVVDDGADPTARRVKVTCEKLSEAEKFGPVFLEFTFGETVAVSVARGADGALTPETSRDRMLAKIDAEGPVTREQLGARYGGKSKTDFDKLFRAET